MYNKNLFVLYKKMYNKNLFLLYKKMYNDNKYSYYTRRCIMTINILVIQEDV